MRRADRGFYQRHPVYHAQTQTTEYRIVHWLFTILLGWPYFIAGFVLAVFDLIAKGEDWLAQRFFFEPRRRFMAWYVNARKMSPSGDRGERSNA